MNGRCKPQSPGSSLGVALRFFPEEKVALRRGGSSSGAEFEQFGHPWNLWSGLDAVRTISDLLNTLGIDDLGATVAIRCCGNSAKTQALSQIDEPTMARAIGASKADSATAGVAAPSPAQVGLVPSDVISRRWPG